jgi:predicted Zn-dependent peptidase
MIGSLLKDFDGPFEQLDCFKSVYRSGLTLEFYNKYVEEIKQVSAKELQELALRYLNPQQMVEISVG